MTECICVFGASSERAEQKYKDAAYRMGEIIAKNGASMIFGAGARGLMGAAARGMHDVGGKIIGVIPERLHQPGIAFEFCDELLVTPTMNERKAIMEQRADAFITLPGGLGTLEELLEVLTLKQLGYIDVPIVILNISGYYDDQLAMIRRCISENFMDDVYINMFFVADTPEAAMEYIKGYVPQNLPNKIER
ncbi:MAG: TIGR00730 family Rossman fold protein [Clostridia bacterium]|nr:TIGR00730 family Rossman fold protein [Clostridia bacterium]